MPSSLTVTSEPEAVRGMYGGPLMPPNDRVIFWVLFTISCLYSLASMDRSSYFLHWDTASQDMAALDLLKGCWGYDAGKPMIMLLLSAPFGLIGANPIIETVLLALLTGLSTGWLYIVTRHSFLNRSWAIVATLWFMSWPTTVYYNRIHLGYALALILAGLAAYSKQKYFLHGVVMGIAILAHPGLIVPACTWIGVAWFLSKDRSLVPPLTAFFGLGFALLSLEVLRFGYTGEPFGWWKGQLADIRAYSGAGADQRWSHVLETLWLVNGPVHSVIGLVGLVGFVLTFRVKRSRLSRTAFFTGVLVLMLYTLRTAFGLSGFNTRLLTGVSPMLAIAVVSGYSGLAGRVRWTIPRSFVAALAVIVLVVMLSIAFLDAGRLSRTSFPILEEAFIRARTLGVPVRYFGQPYPALFFGLKYNVETLVNGPDLESIPLEDWSSVVAIEAESLNEIEHMWEHSDKFIAEEYRKAVYPNPAAANRLRTIEEEFFPSTELLWSVAASVDNQEPVMAILIPKHPSPMDPASFANTGVVSYEWLSYYYHGDGDCQITPRGHPYAYRYYLYLFPRLLQMIGIETQ